MKAFHSKTKIGNTILLFISSTKSAREIDLIHRKVLMEYNPNNLIGAVVDNLNGNQGWSMATCSSTIFKVNQGTQIRNKSVGRWHQPKKIIEEIHLELSSPKSIFAITDNEPIDFLRYIKSRYPVAMLSGLIATPTPFITGKAHTLFFNDQVLSSGSVGLVSEFTNQLVYEDFQPLSEPMDMDDCKGNMILSIKGLNPTSILIQSVANEKNGSLFIKTQNHFKRILGGDFAKGCLAIDSSEPLQPGSVQFFKCAQNTSTIQIGDISIATPAILFEDHIINSPSKLIIE